MNVAEAVEFGPRTAHGVIKHRATAMVPFSVDIKHVVLRPGEQWGTMRHDYIDALLGNRVLHPGAAEAILSWPIRERVVVELGRVGRRVDGEGPTVGQGEPVSAFLQEVEAVVLLRGE